MVTIYALVDPETGIVGYVGQTVDPYARLDSHMKDGEAMLLSSRGKFTAPATTDKGTWIAYLLSQNRAPELRVLEIVDKLGASEREGHWIAEMLRRGEPLTNSLSGQFLERHGVKGHNPYQDCPYQIEFDAAARRAPALYSFNLNGLLKQRELGL